MDSDDKNEILQAIAQLGQRFGLLEGRFDILEDTVSGHTQMLKSLHNKVDAVRVQVAEVNSEVLRLSPQVSALIDAVADLRRDFNNHTHG